MTFPVAQAMKFHRPSNNMAYVKEHNLFVRNGESEAIQLTKDGGNGIVYGQAVHRYEFGITEGLFWSKSGNKLAFYRMDESMVSDYPIYTLNDTPAKSKNIKYPVAGSKSHHVTIGVYDFMTQKMLFLKTEGDPESFLTNITFDEEEDDVIVARVNRKQNKMELMEFNVDDGELDDVYFEETSKQYVEPEHPSIYKDGDEDCYFWMSERDGYNHIYLYKEGKLKKQITKGNWMVKSFEGQDKDYIYFTSTQQSPMDHQYYYIGNNGGEPKRITKESGTHYCIPNHDFSYWIDMFSSTTVPHKAQIISKEGMVINVLLESANPLANYNLGVTKLFTIQNENVDLQSRIILPPNFDSTKKYPVITYVYGGPHAQMITNRFLGGSNYWMQMMAQKGYIVFTLDNRGSKNRGFAFESSIHRKVGDVELSDQLAGVNYLKSLPYVDTTRMGVHGWSFGGFMTTSLMTRFPEAYQVGVAGGPVIDWKFYEIMYTERYMDMPQENSEGYDKNSLFQYITNLQGRLLMIHGTDDDVVLWQHSLLYVKSAVDANNINLDYFVYPGHPHNVRGKDRLHLMGKITQYFEDHL
jgi:dipeptidyl-peptidase-4